MPIPKWCDPKSIRTVKSGKARVLICCPRKKWKKGRCSVGTKAIEVRKFGGFGESVLPKTANGKRYFDHPRGGSIIVTRSGKGYVVWHHEARWGTHDAAKTKQIVAALRAGAL
jgi:hypothetical protein